MITCFNVAFLIVWASISLLLNWILPLNFISPSTLPCYETRPSKSFKSGTSSLLLDARKHQSHHINRIVTDLSLFSSGLLFFVHIYIYIYILLSLGSNSLLNLNEISHPNRQLNRFAKLFQKLTTSIGSLRTSHDLDMC